MQNETRLILNAVDAHFHAVYGLVLTGAYMTN